MERESKFKKLLENEINSSPSRNNKKQSSVKREIKKDLKLQEKRKKMLEKEWNESKSSTQNAYQQNDTTTLNLASHNNTSTQQTNQQTEFQEKKVVAKKLTDEQFQRIKEACGIASNLDESTQEQYQNEDIEKENTFMPSQDTHQQEKQKNSGVSKIDLSEISKLKAEMGIVEPEKHFEPKQNKNEDVSQETKDDPSSTSTRNQEPLTKQESIEQPQSQDSEPQSSSSTQTQEVIQSNTSQPKQEKTDFMKSEFKGPKKHTFASFDFSFDEPEQDSGTEQTQVENQQSQSETEQDNQSQEIAPQKDLETQESEQNNIENKEQEKQDTDHSHETPNTDFIPVSEPPKKSNIVTANMVESSDSEKPKIKKEDKSEASENKEKKSEQERVALTGEAREKKLQELRTKFKTNQVEEKEEGDYKKSLDFSLNTSLKKFKVKPPKKFYTIIGIVISAILLIGSIIGIVIATRPPEPIVIKKIQLSQSSITQIVGDTIDLNGIYIDYIYSDNSTKRVPATKNDIVNKSTNIDYGTLKIETYSNNSFIVFASYNDKGQMVSDAVLTVNVYTYKLSSITSDLIVTNDNATPVIDKNSILVYATYEVKNGNTIMPQYQFSKKIESYTILLEDNNSTQIDVSNNKYELDTSKTYTLTISYSEGEDSSKVKVYSKKQIAYNSSSSAWEIQDII